MICLLDRSYMYNLVFSSLEVYFKGFVGICENLFPLGLFNWNYATRPKVCRHPVPMVLCPLWPELDFPDFGRLVLMKGNPNPAAYSHISDYWFPAFLSCIPLKQSNIYFWPPCHRFNMSVIQHWGIRKWSFTGQSCGSYSSSSLVSQSHVQQHICVYSWAVHILLAVLCDSFFFFSLGWKNKPNILSPWCRRFGSGDARTWAFILKCGDVRTRAQKLLMFRSPFEFNLELFIF